MSQILTQAQKKKLIDIARCALTQYVKAKKSYIPQVEDYKLKKEAGVFVTLRKEGNLRGCLGSITARGPLYLEVQNMAVAAAGQDLRFRPVAESELKDINIEISILSPLKKVDNSDEIIFTKHGVLVKKGSRSGVFLPQVAKETGWSKDEFMANLCQHKAGLSADCWKEGNCDIFIFTAEVFGE